MVESDLVEAVIGLAHGLFYNSGMEAIVLVLNANKPAGRRGKVLFVDAKTEYYRSGVQSFLSDSHQARMLNAYRRFADEPGFAAVATLDQIAQKGHNLAIPAYVKSGPSAVDAVVGGPDNTTAVVQAWRAAAKTADSTVTEVLALLRAEGPA